MFRGSFAALLLLILSFPVAAQEWTRFRGPNGSGVGQAAGLPVEWSERDYAWRTKLPGSGIASPVLWGDRLFTTAADAEQKERFLVCLSATDGKLVWTRAFSFDPYDKHKVNGFATSTPAVDADRVYALWQSPESSYVVALDHEGREAWRHDLGPFAGNHGGGVSLIRHADLVIVPCDQDQGSYVLALNAADGKPRWRLARRSTRATYATPCVYEAGGRPAEIIFTDWRHGITAVDPKSGEVNWERSVFGKGQERAIASPVIAGDLVIGTCGFTTSTKHVVALRPMARGGSTEAEEVYHLTRGTPHLPTPLVHAGLLFLWTEQGILSCCRASTGEQLWQERIGGTFSASPICADGKLYNVNVDGGVVVVAAAETFTRLGQGVLGEAARATPAIANGRLYFRSDSHVMMLGPNRK